MELHHKHGIAMIKLTGADLSDPLALHNRFQEIIIHQGDRKLLVDLSEVSYMNSMQIGGVVGLHVLAYENLAMIKFVGLHARVQSLFGLLGVDTLLDMHYARAKGAMESFGIYEPVDEAEFPSLEGSDGSEGEGEGAGSSGSAPSGTETASAE